MVLHLHSHITVKAGACLAITRLEKTCFRMLRLRRRPKRLSRIRLRSRTILPLASSQAGALLLDRVTGECAGTRKGLGKGWKDRRGAGENRIGAPPSHTCCACAAGQWIEEEPSFGFRTVRGCWGSTRPRRRGFGILSNRWRSMPHSRSRAGIRRRSRSSRAPSDAK